MNTILLHTTFHHNRQFQSKELLLLRFLTFCVFFGRAWQHWFWDIPIRSFFWDEALLKGVVETVSNLSWEEYVLSPAVETTLENLVFGLGFVYGALAIIALIIKVNHHKWFKASLVLGSFLLFLLAGLYWKEKFMSVGQFMEYALQITTPIFLYYTLLHKSLNIPSFRFLIRLMIAFTFIGHGLYALGYYPVPGSYVQMTLDITGLSESTTYTLLKVMGILDLIVVVVLFIPRLIRPALIYCIVWGTLTALARIVANFDMEIPWESWHQWGHTTIYRLPHGGIPLLLWWLIQKQES